MDVQGIIEELRAMGSESTKRTLLKHGAQEPFFGTKIGDMKPIVKREKVNHELALALYDTGISDAKYLAGLIADDPKMTRENLQHWVEGANWAMLSESTVPWVAVGGNHGREMAIQWIDSPVETIACAGWSTFSNLVSIKPDTELDISELKSLLKRVETSLQGERNRVKYNMNGFVISVASYVSDLTQSGLDTARTIGKVSVNVGETACKIRDAATTIAEMQERGLIGKKRKTVKC